MKYTLIIFLLVLLSNSCTQIRYFNIEVLEPAQKDFPLEIKKLLLVERVPIIDKNNSDNYYFQGNNRKDSLHITRIATTNYIQNVTNILNATQRFQAIALIDPSQSENFQFDWTFVSELCEKYKADAVLSLEMLSLEDKSKFRLSSVENIMGGLTFKIYGKSEWRFWYPKTKEILDESMINDTLTLKGRGYDFQDALSTIASPADYVQTITKNMAQTYSSWISPVWRETSRIFYAGDLKMRDATKFARNGKWKEAAQVWKKNINSKNILRAEVACFNLAVACEMEGLLESALDWAEKAHKFSNSENAEKYINILKKRIEKANQLNRNQK